MGRVARVLPDVPAIDRAFDYSVPDALGDRVRVGAMVRIPLHGRRVAGWVVDDDSTPPPGVKLAPIARVSGIGPDADVIELCRWAAWRWAGRLPTMLRLGSPDRAVGSLPSVRVRAATGGDADVLAAEALALGPGAHVVEVPPTADAVAVAIAAARLGQVLVVHPSVVGVDLVARGLRRAGASVARWPSDFAAAAAGATVVGGRGAVFAPLPALAAVVVWDEHDEGLQNESSPTWHAREVAVERARRAGVPCLLVSPCPSLEARSAARGPVVSPGRAAMRAGWAPLVVADRRQEDVGRTGLYSSALVDAVRETARAGDRVVCVLNRTGRARLLACRSCGTLAECEACGAAVHLTDALDLACGRCGTHRPSICMECGSMALSVLRAGVTRAREELEALAMEPVRAVTAGGNRAAPAATEDLTSADAERARILIGTEAVLHRVPDAGLVAFLDLDQELLAPRYRASEEALHLLVLASRLVGGRSRGGRVLVQTRRPDHEVVQAALHADGDRVAAVEAGRRRLLGFPPAATIAVVGGEAAGAYVERVGNPLGVEVQGPDDGRWLLRSDEPSVLLDHLATVDRPPGRLRLWVDPARIR